MLEPLRTILHSDTKREKGHRRDCKCKLDRIRKLLSEVIVRLSKVQRVSFTYPLKFALSIVLIFLFSAGTITFF
jgi:hypothetical protein